MSDILQLQNYLFLGLRSCALFDAFNVIQEREWLMSSEINFNALWQAPRAARGLVGAGLLVEMPKLDITKPNSLQRNLVVSIGVIEERNLNMTAGVGSLVSSEEIAEMALDFMFGWVVQRSSALTPESGTVRPAPDLIKGDGLVTYRAAVSLRREHHAVARCDTPVLSEPSAGTFALANGALTPDAAIYYTTDESFPGRANSAAVLYAGPVALAVGTVLTFAAWRGDRLPSHLTARVVTA